MPENGNRFVTWKVFFLISLTILGLVGGFHYFSTTRIEKQIENSSNRIEKQIEKMIPRNEFNLINDTLTELKTDVKANGKQLNNMSIKFSRLEPR